MNVNSVHKSTVKVIRYFGYQAEQTIYLYVVLCSVHSLSFKLKIWSHVTVDAS